MTEACGVKTGRDSYVKVLGLTVGVIHHTCESVYNTVTCTNKLTIRASVDALCRDGAVQISRERVQRGRLTRQGTRS